MGGFFGWIIVGLAAGWIAGKLTDTERGLIGNLILGLVGGIVAGWLVDVCISDDSGLIISIVVLGNLHQGRLRGLPRGCPTGTKERAGWLGAVIAIILLHAVEDGS